MSNQHRNDPSATEFCFRQRIFFVPSWKRPSMSSFVPSCQPSGYEKHSSEGWNTATAAMDHTLTTQYGDLDIERFPETERRNSPLLPKNRQHVDALENYGNPFYRKGVSRQIDLIEQMLGTTIRRLPQCRRSTWLSLSRSKLSIPGVSRYAVIYCDAIPNLRRDSAAKEALHVMLGITPEGNKEVPDYAIYPSESAYQLR